MILRFDPVTHKTKVFTNHSGKSNGQAFDTSGFLISCDGADGTELAFLPTGPTNQQGEFEEWKGIPSNVEFGTGDEKNVLYVTIDKSLYRIRTKTEGYHHAYRSRR